MTRPGLIILYILCVWFVLSFVTNLLGPLMPIAIRDFQLSLALAGFLPFSFFLAYGIVSIPAGMLAEVRGPRTVLLLAFSLNFLGALAIAVTPEYWVIIGGLFVMGLGMAMLQVVINPLTRTAGGEGHFAFFSVMGQLVFGLASFVSPLAFRAVMQQASAPGPSDVPWLTALMQLAPDALPWVSFYAAFALLFLPVLAVTYLMRLPKLQLSEAERSGTREVYLSLLQNKHARLFFVAIVAYVGTEQSLANWMSQYLSIYHGLSPTTAGAQTVSSFWGLMSAGCLLGLVLLRLLDARVVLAAFSTLAIGCLAAALFGASSLSRHAFAASGFFLSVMFSVIFSLALNSVQSHHGALSGILCTGILGGALLPLLIGILGDWVGLKLALTALFLTLGYILSISFWAKPLIRNETVTWRARRAATAVHAGPRDSI